LKLLEKNLGKTFEDVGIGDDILNKLQWLKKPEQEMNDKWDHIKLKNVPHIKGKIITLKRQ
jgi:hypothetical protein